MSKEIGKKVFVAGCYDNRIFKGNFFDGMCLYSKADCYSLEEVLKLSFVENIEEWFEENEERAFREITEEEKINAILDYIQYDEIANIEYLETEEKALKRKNELLEEINDIEEKIKIGEIVYIGQKQDQYGNFRDVYKLKLDLDEEE